MRSRVIRATSLLSRQTTIFFLLSLALPAHADTIARQFAVGTGPESVGRLQLGEDTEQDGPQAIYTGRAGEIYLLDQANGRVVSFDGKDKTSPTRSLTLPDGIEATDMIAIDSGLVVWDGKPIALEAHGDGLNRSLTVARGLGDDEDALSMFTQTGSQDPGTAADALAGATRSMGSRSNDDPFSNSVRKSAATHGAGPVSVVIATDANRTSVDLLVISKSSQAKLGKLHLKSRDRLGSVELLEIDTLGNMYVLAEIVPSDEREHTKTFVAQFAQNSEFEGIYELPLAPDVALARRFVTVSPFGDVYFLRTRKGVVDVLGVALQPMKKNQVIETRRRPVTESAAANSAVIPSPGHGRIAITAIGPLTRQRVVETAFGFEGIQWRVSASNYGPDPDHHCDGFDRIRRPGYLIGMLNRQARGVPYCWGCHGSLAQFKSRIDSGALAGNVCTRNDPRSDVVGVDCSSFVSAAWGLSTHFTTDAIPSIAPRIDPWSMKPGDALNKPGSHVMLFLGYTVDRKVQVMEASPGGCNGRVCRNVHNLGAMLESGYVPRRFGALAGDSSAPQVSESLRPEAGDSKPSHAVKDKPAKRQARATPAAGKTWRPAPKQRQRRGEW